MAKREGLLGRKMGMSRIFDERGENVPITVIEAGPCYVTQIKTVAKDGSVQGAGLRALSHKTPSEAKRSMLGLVSRL